MDILIGIVIGAGVAGPLGFFMCAMFAVGARIPETQRRG